MAEPVTWEGVACHRCGADLRRGAKVLFEDWDDAVPYHAEHDDPDPLVEIDNDGNVTPAAAAERPAGLSAERWALLEREHGECRAVTCDEVKKVYAALAAAERPDAGLSAAERACRACGERRGLTAVRCCPSNAGLSAEATPCLWCKGYLAALAAAEVEVARLREALEKALAWLLAADSKAEKHGCFNWDNAAVKDVDCPCLACEFRAILKEPKFNA